MSGASIQKQLNAIQGHPILPTIQLRLEKIFLLVLAVMKNIILQDQGSKMVEGLSYCTMKSLWVLLAIQLSI